MGITDGNNAMAIIPIAEALPELRAEQFAKVREWDAARMALVGEYEAADGEYLSKIRDALQRADGKKTPLWKGYLQVRGIPYDTANDRIRKAEGRPHVHAPNNGDSPLLHAPQPQITEASYRPAPIQDTANWTPAPPSHSYDDEPMPATWTDWTEAADDEDIEDAPASLPPIYQTEPDPEAVQVEAVPSVTTYSVKAWAELHPDVRLSEIELGREGKAGLNKQDNDNIEWAKWSWNPITGCLHECPYCYARDIANRFYPQGFAPTFHPFRLGAPFHQHVPAQAETELGYRNIFTCSMADLFGKWVPADWIEAVLDVIRENQQWNFLLLTKFPNRLAEFTFPDNAWLGTSVDCQARVKNAEKSFAKVQGGVKWLSIEPMLEPLHFDSLDMFNWVVIGGASASTQTPEWIPPRRWVLDLESQAKDAGCMIYEKTNLGFGIKLPDGTMRQAPSRLREYPGWERSTKKLPDALAYLPSIQQE